MVLWLARDSAHRKARNGARLASEGMEGLLALEVAAPANSGRRPIRDEVRLLIRRLASENILWGQRRIQAELARLGFKVSARTVAKYMRLPHDREPSPGWRTFVERHAAEIWACDFFCVQTMVQDPACLLRGQPRQS